MAQVPDIVTRQSAQALLAGIDAAEAAMAEAHEGVRGQVTAQFTANSDKAAAVRLGQQAHLVQLGQVEEYVVGHALACRPEDTFSGFGTADGKLWQEQRTTFASYRLLVHVAMPGSPVSGGRQEARSGLRDVRDSVAGYIAKAASVRSTVADFSRDLRARGAVLDEALERVRAAVRAPDGLTIGF